jgi:hypothetical protein
MSMDRKPQTYHEWRDLFHREQKYLGFLMWHQFKRDRRVYMTKEAYQVIRRIERIKKQLEAEFDAGTTSAMQALLEVIFPKDTD